MEIEPKSIPIDTQNDIVQLRNMVRRMMQQLQAPVYDQSRVSWMIDYVGRQILMFARSKPVKLATVNEQGRIGLKMVCEGSWLRPMGYFYSRHLLIPHMTESDTVQYKDGVHPELTIIAWINNSTVKGE